MKTPRLGLGTVQFGGKYGISNTRGRVPAPVVGEILGEAAEAGIRLLDTAASYGDSESVIGAALRHGHRFHIATKTPAFGEPELTKRHATLLYDSLRRSLDNLRSDSLYGLLLHDPTSLARPGCEYVIEALIEVRAERLVQKIGISVYDGAEIDTALAFFRPDIVQFPLNLLDQRLLRSGHITRLSSLGVELHARSPFLQGLLLMPIETLPGWTAPIRSHLASMRDKVERAGLTPIQACLAFVAEQSEIDALLVGVTAREELVEIIAAMNASSADLGDLAKFALNDERYVLPSNWPQ